MSDNLTIGKLVEQLKEHGLDMNQIMQTQIHVMAYDYNVNKFEIAAVQEKSGHRLIDYPADDAGNKGHLIRLTTFLKTGFRKPPSEHQRSHYVNSSKV